MKEIAKKTEEKNEMAVGSAMIQLMKMGLIDRFDIPGQRVKGTRVKAPQQRASQIPVDEKQLREKEARDREKLKSMIEFCYARSCREAWILNYFGSEPKSCGRCDDCRKSAGEERRVPNDEERMIIRKTLSGVARMSWKTSKGWKARFGKGKIVKMLVGSKAQDIKDGKLDQLSTYGLLRQEGQEYVSTLLNNLISAGLLVVDAGEYPTVTLSASGSKMMRDETYECTLAIPKESLKTYNADQGGPSSLTLKPHDFDGALYDELRAVRRKLAQHENCPEYVIFSNKVIENLCIYRPQSAEEALQIQGVGKVKVRQYFPEFLPLLKR